MNIDAYKNVSDCKGGIFASGSNREIFVTAEWVEFTGGGEVYLDFFSVAQGGGDIKAEKHFIAAGGLFGLGQPVLAKIAVGDFNGDGYANEIALLTNCYDVWKYYLSVYQVNWKGSAIEVTTMVQAKELYSNEVGSDNNTRDLWYFKAAGDVVMADFNGDGRTEIAAIYKGYNEDKNNNSWITNAVGSVYVKLFQWNSSKPGTDKLVESKIAATKNFTETGEGLNGIGDLKAVAADVDGDGKSELAMLGMHWKTKMSGFIADSITVTWGTWTTRLHLWRHSPTANAVETDIAATLNMAYDKGIQNFGSFYQNDRGIYSDHLNRNSTRSAIKSHTFTDTAFEMTSGVFSGAVSSNNRPCEDIVVSNAGYEKSCIKVISPVLDNNEKLKSDFKVTAITAFDSTSKTIGLAAGDFAGDGILLKNPYHFYFEGRNVFTSIIQALPYHVDYIPLPWEKDGKPKLANLTYVPGGEVTYVRTTETKDKKTVKTTSTPTYEMKTKLGASVSWSPTEFIPWAPANPNDKFSPKHSFLFNANVNYTGKDTAQKLETSTETVKTTETIKSTAVDSIMAHSVRHHFWRYPIGTVPAWYKARSKDITDDGKLAYTVTMSEAPKSHKGRIGYNARHEEGNLFSYPTKMDNIPDFTNANSKILTEAVEYLLEPGEYKKEVAITMSKEK